MSVNTLAAASVSTGGSPGDNHNAQGNTTVEHQNIDITPDGRFVVFTSDADNLDAGDTNTNRDVYLRDFQTNTTNLVSRNANGQTLGGDSFNVSVSADARFVAFDNLPVTGGGYNIKVLDRSFNIVRNAPYTTTAAGESN